MADMSSDHTIALDAIGTIHTRVADDAVAKHRRDICSTIVLFDRYAEGLAGIEHYSHLFVLFWLHRATAPTQLTAHPRGDPTLPVTGVFAARGRNHPNGIGLAVVELIECQGATLTVRRLDAYDGTPVLDLKPYDEYDIVANPQVPGWWRQHAMTPRKDPR